MLMAEKTIMETASGLMPVPETKVTKAGTQMPSTAMTEPMNMWMITVMRASSSASTKMLLGTASGRTTLAIQVFMPVAPPTVPMAMAAVRKTRVLMGTESQDLGVRISPTKGSAMPAPMISVTKPMFMPVMPSVIHRATAMASHTTTRFSVTETGPSSACFWRTTSRSSLNSLCGLKRVRPKPRVASVATSMGTLM